MEGLAEITEPPENEEENIKTTDLNPEDLQGMISDLSVKMEEDRRTSEELEVTIRSQRESISNLKREKRLLKALKDSIDMDIKQMQKERSEMSGFLSGSQVANLTNKERAKLLKQQRALQEQLGEYRLALDSCCQDLDKRWMDIERLEGCIEELLTVIKELKAKNIDLEDQLAQAMGFGGPHVDQCQAEEQLPHSYVEVCDVEEEQIAPDVEKQEQDPSVDIEVQTKSWWRRQGENLWKGLKRMGTILLGVMRCQRLRSCMRRVFRSNRVHPTCDGMLPV